MGEAKHWEEEPGERGRETEREIWRKAERKQMKECLFFLFQIYPGREGDARSAIR